MTRVALRGRRATAMAILVAAVTTAPPLEAAPTPPKGPARSTPLSPLALLPSIARVKVTSHGSALSVVEEVNLPRGEWAGDTLRFYVAFGSPGPRAIDARLVAVGDGELEADDAERGEVLSTERASRRPANAHPLIGSETMAGVVVVVPASAFAKALAQGNMATLRLRSLVDAPEDRTGALSAVVRLGASRGTPLTLGRITVTSSDKPVTRAEAKLCGRDAEVQPLAVEILPRTSPRAIGGAIAPVLAVRHAGDDLCLRLWH